MINFVNNLFKTEPIEEVCNYIFNLHLTKEEHKEKFFSLLLETDALEKDSEEEVLSWLNFYFKTTIF